MLGANEQRSQVARLISQITAEYEAAQRGLTGISSGSSQHATIAAHMENMALCRNQLGEIVGQNTATAMMSDALDNLPL